MNNEARTPSFSYGEVQWYNKRYCPVCKSRNITYADIEPCCFNGANDAKLGKIVILRVWHCCDCGFVNFVNNYDDYQSEW